MTGRISAAWINGMGILLPILHIVIAVVSTRGQGTVTEAQNKLIIARHRARLFRRPIHPNAPGQTFSIKASADHLPTKFYQIVGTTLVGQISSHHIHAVAFRYGRGIQHYAGITLEQTVALPRQGLHAHIPAKTVDKGRTYLLFFLKTKSPG